MTDLFRPLPSLTAARLEALRTAARGPLYRVPGGYRARGGSLIQLATVSPLLIAGLLRRMTAAGKAAVEITPEGVALVEAKRRRKVA